MRYRLLTLFLLSFVLSACDPEGVGDMDIEDVAARAQLIERLLAERPPSRSFSMGFAYQPYDWHQEAFDETARILNDHADIIGIFYDGAIPWPEAAANSAYHPDQEDVLARRHAAIQPHHEVLVSTSLLGGDRVSLARYLGETDLPRPGKWKDKSFDDPEVVAAYLNWCRDLIRRFNPDYFVYVMEVDAAFVDVEDPRFQQLFNAIRQIYPILKSESPSLPLILEFTLMNDEEMAKRQDVVDALLPYTDIYGVSTYPFLHAGGNPDDIQRNWFSRVKAIAPEKPFAIIETNHLAEDFIHPTLGISVPGNDAPVLIPGRETWQASYLGFLFAEAQKLDTRFVIQWTSRDLDRLAALWRGTGSSIDPDIEPMANLANDCGIYDENGRGRPSLSVWNGWLELPRATAQ